MRDFETHLFGVWLLVGALCGCRQHPTPPDGAGLHRTHTAVVSSSQGKPSDSSPSHASPSHAAAQGTNQGREVSAEAAVPTPEQRKACLGPPLSPGPDQLPEVEGLRHVIEDTRHLFLPERAGLDPLRADGDDDVARRIQKAAGSGGTPSLGLCGTEPSYRAFRCLRLAVPICKSWLEEVHRLAPAVRVEGLGIVVEIEGRTEPRCAPGEPDCGPVPYHLPSRDASRAAHEWAGDFTLPLRAGVALQTLRDDLSSGRCTHAGDCVRAGCGNHCDAWYEPVYGANCPAFAELADAYCGCVEGQCAWFTQPETAKLRARVTVKDWQGPIPIQEAPQPTTANELFERRLSGAWMLRQMRRLSPLRSLPKQVEFSFVWHPNTRLSALVVKTDGQPAPDWVVTLFHNLPLPSPEVSPFRPVRVEGVLHVEEE